MIFGVGSNHHIAIWQARLNCINDKPCDDGDLGARRDMCKSIFMFFYIYVSVVMLKARATPISMQSVILSNIYNTLYINTYICDYTL